VDLASEQFTSVTEVPVSSSGAVEFTFDTPAAVLSGTSYAIVAQALDNCRWVLSSSAAYPGGDGYFSSAGNFWFIMSDFPFATIIDPDIVDNCPSVVNPFQENSDSDGTGDACDNCTLIENTDQIDTDGDGHGNSCDGDFNNDCSTNIFDLFDFKEAFGDPSADAQFDLNSTGGPVQVNIFDLFVFKGLFGLAPGPSVEGLCP